MKRRRHQPISNINVVPYLDVLLVLLVIFMITAPLFNQGVIDLPTVGEQPLPEAKNAQLEIWYEQRQNHPYRLLDHLEKAESKKLNEAELIVELGKKSILYDDLHIIISASGDLEYKAVVKLLGLLRDKGYNNIALSAEFGKNDER